MKEKINLCVIGLGYIGLPTATIFALHGAQVTGVDVSSRVLGAIRQGKSHFIEPELDAVLAQVVANESLAVNEVPVAAEVFIIAVPTPFKDQFQPDLSYVEAATASLASVLKKGDLIILESTSPVGTTQKIADQLSTLRPDLSFPAEGVLYPDVHVCYCPERVLPGRILYELVQNDRVIGGLTSSCTEKACTVYQLFVKGQCLKTDAKTAEMAKLTENAFRDVNIAFANELSMVCDELNINTWELIKLANHHPRVNILQPGPGVGGHCIAVDPWFIISASKKARLLKTAREVNNDKPEFVLKKIEEAVGKLKHAKITCFGLSYKKDIDDLRESPAVEIVKKLCEKEVAVNVFEPHIQRLPDALSSYSYLTLIPHLDEAMSSDVLVFLVDHTMFKELKSVTMVNKIVIDVCGLFA